MDTTKAMDMGNMPRVPIRIDGGRIRELRRERGLSQEQLARRSLLSNRTIFRLESGETVQTRELTILALARALGVEPAELLAEGQSPNTLPGTEPF
jgi:transcriptional regulator with XRE-family HTH domain